MRRLKIANIVNLQALSLTLVILILLTIVGGLITLGVTQQKNINSLTKEIELLQKEVSRIQTSNSDISQAEKLGLLKGLLTVKNNKINSQNAIYGTLAQVLGGAFFFITAYLSLQNLKIAEQTLRSTEEKQVTEHFSRAIEHLANKDRPEIQLGGIYALERISNDSHKDYWSIINILTLFVRANSPTAKLKDEIKDTSSSVQAALMVIGQRDRQQDSANRQIDLSGISLSRTHLKNVNFSDIELIETDLRESYLSDINLSRAKLKGARLCNINRRVNTPPIRNIDFTGAVLIYADLTGANFTRTIFRRATLDFAKLNTANLSSADFSQATFIQADLRNADLSGANFSESSFQGADLKGADLKGATFSKTQITAEQIQSTKNWQSLDKKLLEKLGLVLTGDA